MPEVLPLKDICLGSIPVHIWNTKFVKDDIVAKVQKENNKMPGLSGWLWENSKIGHTEMEKYTNEIMECDFLPKTIKLKLSLSLITLVNDFKYWCEDIICKMYKKKSKDIKFVLDNTVFDPIGYVARAETLVKCLFDSQNNLAIDDTELGLLCNINMNLVISLAEKYNIIDQNLTITIISKITKFPVQIAWLKFCWDETTLDKQEKIHDSATKAHISIIEYLYAQVEDTNKSAMLTKMLINIMQEVPYHTIPSYQTPLKIVFMYHRLDNEIWKNVIKLHGKKILSIFFTSHSHHEYFVGFYKQFCTYAPEECVEVLQNLLLIMTDTELKYCQKVFNELMKSQYFTIWNITPPSIKNYFISDTKSISLALIKDYEIIMYLVKDTDITEINRKELVYFIFLYNLKNKHDNVSKALSEQISSDFNINRENIERNVLIDVIIKHFSLVCPNMNTGLFNNKHELAKFKTEFNNYNNITSKALLYLLRHNKVPFTLLLEIEDLLKWCFTKRQIMMVCKKYFIYDELFINVYKIYLNDRADDNPEYSDPDVYYYNEDDDVPNNFIGKMLKSKTMVVAIKKMITETDFVHKTIKSVFGTRYIRYCFNGLLSYAEKENRIYNYMTSEEGLVHIFTKYIHNTYADVVYFERYVFKETLQEYSMFHNHWVRAFPFYFHRQLSDYMYDNGYNVYHKHFKLPNEENLLPHQSLDQHKHIVNRLFSIFVCMVCDDTKMKIPYKEYRPGLLQTMYLDYQRELHLVVPKLFPE